MKLTEVQDSIVNDVINNDITLINAFAGTGKEQPYSEPTLTPNGWVNFGDLNTNDKVIGSNGEPINIEKIYEQGVKDVYAIKFCDGSVTRCGLEHLWFLYNKNTKQNEVLSLEQLLNSNLSLYSIKLPKNINFNTNNILLYPFLLGVLLSNKDVVDENLYITNNINSTLNVLKSNLPISDTIIQIKKYHYKIVNKNKNEDSYTKKILQEYKLYKLSQKNKFIPSNYIFNNISIRKKLFDGIFYNNDNFYITNSKVFCDNIVELSRSLSKYTSYKKRNIINSNLISYKITVSKKRYKNILSITYLNKETSRCIKVSAKDNLYITNDYTITHNTTVLNAISNKYKYDNFLYLVFNKSMSDKAKEKFPDNVKVVTINGLAYRYTREKLNLKEISNCFKLIELKNYLNINNYNLALLIYHIFNIFCNSSYKDINKKIVKEIINGNNELTLLYKDNEYYLNEITKNIGKLWDDMYENKIPMTHNFYLKFFHLNIDYFKEFINYDFILLDECLTEDHYINSSIGNILIKDLYNLFANDNTKKIYVNSYNIVSKKLEYKLVTNAIKSDNRKVYKILFENNEYIKCTGNHPLLTENGYKKVHDIIVNEDKILNENNEYIKIIDVIYCGLDTVYDISVKDNNNFIASNSNFNSKCGYIVHNCQDTNMLTVDIFKSLNGKKVLVGDKYQSIYSFRGAINAMDKFPTAKQHYLTETFRFNDKIANKANFVLNNILGEREKVISYFPNKTGEIKTKCIITRTNSGVINSFFEKYKDNKIVKTLRNPDEIFMLPLSLYYFLEDKTKYKDKIKVKWLYNFRSRLDIKQYATKVNDIELITSLNIVEEFDSDLITIYNIAKEFKRKRKVDLYITTAHTCKGLEFDYVQLYDDFPNIIQRISKKYSSIEEFKIDVINNLHYSDEELNKIVEEIRLYYVAITRAIYEIDLDITNSEMFNLSNGVINNLIENYRSIK